MIFKHARKLAQVQIMKEGTHRYNSRSLPRGNNQFENIIHAPMLRTGHVQVVCHLTI